MGDRPGCCQSAARSAQYHNCSARLPPCIANSWHDSAALRNRQGALAAAVQQTAVAGFLWCRPPRARRRVGCRDCVIRSIVPASLAQPPTFPAKSIKGHHCSARDLPQSLLVPAAGRRTERFLHCTAALWLDAQCHAPFILCAIVAAPVPSPPASSAHRLSHARFQPRRHAVDVCGLRAQLKFDVSFVSDALSITALDRLRPL
jgi:hypothetical protein